MYFFEEGQWEKNKPFLISDQEGTVTYGDLDSFTEIMGKKLKKRKLVFLLCRNTPGSVMGYFSFLRKGVVPLLLEEEIEYDKVKRLMERYEPDYLYVPEERTEFACGTEKLYCGHHYCLYGRNNPEDTVLYEDLALLLTTSGSTGSPKLVRQSYENIQSNAEAIVRYLELDSRERPITTLPMSYTYGLSIIHSHAACGAAVLMTEFSMFQQEFWDFFRKEKATSFGGVPFTYEMLDRLHFFQMNLPSLRTMTQAGGKLSKSLQKKFVSYAEHTGRNFIIMYGQTEATARMSYLPREYAGIKAGSIGIPIPGGKFDIVQGELVYKGKNVTLGYAEKREDLAKGDERHGVLYTGDMARVDGEGFYYITGRKKRFIKILGKRINLDEVEQILKEEYPEITAVCTGKDDHLNIFVEKREKIQEAELLDFISGSLHMNESSFHLIRLERFPVNESGKIRYSELEGGECLTN